VCIELVVLFSLTRIPPINLDGLGLIHSYTECFIVFIFFKYDFENYFYDFLDTQNIILIIILNIFHNVQNMF